MSCGFRAAGRLVPYLEKGEKTSFQTSTEFQRVFGGRFINFMMCINY